MEITDLIRDGYDKLHATPKLWPGHNGALVDRNKYVTASEAGNCPRRIKFGKAFPRNGFPKWGYAERGHLIEAWAVECMRAAMPDGAELLYAGDEQVTFTHDKQSGTPDGVVKMSDGTLWCVEIKSIDPRTNRKNLPKQPHVSQLHQNMDLVQQCMGIKVTHGQIIYINASDLQDRTEFTILPDYTEWDKLYNSARKIMKTPANNLPATGIHNGECQMCDYAGRCSALIKQQQNERKEMAKAERATNGIFK